MATLTDTEKSALNDLGFLTRFAAENVEKLDMQLLRDVAEARDAAEKGNWTPEVSQKFWSAFNTLCLLIRPVTMDCLTATRQRFASFNWFRFRKEPVSLAARSSRRYLFLLFFFITVSLALQLYVWLCTMETKLIDSNLSKSQENAAALKTDYLKWNAEATDGLTHVSDADQRQQAEALQFRADNLNSDLERLRSEACVLREITDVIDGLGRTGGARARREYLCAATQEQNRLPSAQDPGPSGVVNSYTQVLERYSTIKDQSLMSQERANFSVGIIVSFILPLLLGTIGAIAYVIREMSNQISRATFSESSPIRHLMPGAPLIRAFRMSGTG